MRPYTQDLIKEKLLISQRIQTIKLNRATMKSKTRNETTHFQRYR